MGLPVITTDRGGIPETVTPESAVILNAKKLLSNKISEAILDLYGHPEKRQAMGTAALERSRLFGKERYAKEFFEAIASF